MSKPKFFPIVSQEFQEQQANLLVNNYIISAIANKESLIPNEIINLCIKYYFEFKKHDTINIGIYGEQVVGKTTLTWRFNNISLEELLIEDTFYKNILINGSQYELQIFDSNGIQLFICLLF